MSTREALAVYFYGTMMYSLEQINGYMYEDIVDPSETATYQKIGSLMMLDTVCMWGMEATASIEHTSFLENLDVLKVDYNQLHSEIWQWGIDYLTKVAENAPNIRLISPKKNWFTKSIVSGICVS